MDVTFEHRRAPGPGRRVGALLFLYVGFPVLIGALFGWNRTALHPEVSLAGSMSYWLLLASSTWIGAALGAHALHWAFRSLRPPLWAVTLGGAMLAAVALNLPYRAILEVSADLNPTGARLFEPVPAALTWRYAHAFLADVAPGTLLWIGVNYFYDRALGVPRYRYPPAPAREAASPAGAETGACPVLARLPDENAGALRAMKAEDHYVKVLTSTGAFLIHGRFSDFIASVETPGLRVHRSWWVAFDGVERLHVDGSRSYLDIAGGERVPVSRTYLRDARTRFAPT